MTSDQYLAHHQLESKSLFVIEQRIGLIAFKKNKLFFNLF